MGDLLKCFQRVTRRKIYENILQEKFIFLFNEIIHELCDHSLIRIITSKTGTQIMMPLTVKVPIQDEFVSSLDIIAAEKTMNEKIRVAEKPTRWEYVKSWVNVSAWLFTKDDEQYKLDLKKLVWFREICAYFNSMNFDLLSHEDLSVLSSLIDFMRSCTCSDRLKAEFINQSKLLQSFINAIQHRDSGLIQKCKKLPANGLYILVEAAISKSLGTLNLFPENPLLQFFLLSRFKNYFNALGDAYINLGEMFVYIDIDRAIRLFELAGKISERGILF